MIACARIMTLALLPYCRHKYASAVSLSFLKVMPAYQHQHARTRATPYRLTRSAGLWRLASRLIGFCHASHTPRPTWPILITTANINTLSSSSSKRRLTTWCVAVMSRASGALYFYGRLCAGLMPFPAIFSPLSPDKPPFGWPPIILRASFISYNSLPPRHAHTSLKYHDSISYDIFSTEGARERRSAGEHIVDGRDMTPGHFLAPSAILFLAPFTATGHNYLPRSITTLRMITVLFHRRAIFRRHHARLSAQRTHACVSAPATHAGRLSTFPSFATRREPPIASAYHHLLPIS